VRAGGQEKITQGKPYAFMPLRGLQFGHFKTVKPGEILGFCQVKVFVFLLASEFCLV
jgi:hypothetical protein